MWSVTVGPWPHDVYNYQFNVDGVIAMDPVNPAVKLGFGAFPPANLVEVPGDGPRVRRREERAAWHGADGDVSLEGARCAAHAVDLHAARLRPRQHRAIRCSICCTAPGNIDSSWMLTGRANLIMDNLIAEGKTRPMIIVNPLGYARPGVNLGPGSRRRARARRRRTAPGRRPEPGDDALRT